jgi:hypothetical protein
MAIVTVNLPRDCDEFLNRTANEKKLGKNKLVLQILEKRVAQEASHTHSPSGSTKDNKIKKKMKTALRQLAPFMFLLVLYGCDIDDKPVGKTPDGNLALINADKGTTIQKEAVKKENLGKTLNFEGKVEDVISDSKIEVRIDSGNYANVVFATPSPSVGKLEKGSSIKFTATLKVYGTGIMIKHDLEDAKILP